MAGTTPTLRDHPLPSSNAGRTHGMLGEFQNPMALVEAAREVRKEGYRYYDAHSPFPVHGMDRAMGLGQSILGYLVFGAGLTGVGAATLMQWWMGEVDYPLLISGKPFFSIEPSMPVIFEVMVLFSALTAVFGMLALNRLPRPYNPLFNSDRFAAVSDDAFFLHLEARDPHFDTDTTRALLERLGATHVELVEDHDGAE